MCISDRWRHRRSGAAWPRGIHGQQCKQSSGGQTNVARPASSKSRQCQNTERCPTTRSSPRERRHSTAPVRQVTTLQHLKSPRNKARERSSPPDVHTPHKPRAFKKRFSFIFFNFFNFLVLGKTLQPWHTFASK